ncbi:MAG: hypothetical protein Q4F01_09415 [Staphylococcus rostri]|uniref:DUF7222 domain-containing protein n=1 Tax=Staphylococcus rostri TaxID=522262 RepID=UPI0026DFA7FB|nr:hypothetical protein [Staphylococcus rostri]MDO5376384.1 hypothetical protein [Staphylococcus rostri]
MPNNYEVLVDIVKELGNENSTIKEIAEYGIDGVAPTGLISYKEREEFFNKNYHIINDIVVEFLEELGYNIEEMESLEALKALKETTEIKLLDEDDYYSIMFEKAEEQAIDADPEYFFSLPDDEKHDLILNDYMEYVESEYTCQDKGNIVALAVELACQQAMENDYVIIEEMPDIDTIVDEIMAIDDNIIKADCNRPCIHKVKEGHAYDKSIPYGSIAVKGLYISGVTLYRKRPLFYIDKVLTPKDEIVNYYVLGYENSTLEVKETTYDKAGNKQENIIYIKDGKLC